MNLRLEMLQVARLASRVLGESTDLVRQFVLGQLDSQGGFLDRRGVPDLYYTVFGLNALVALQSEIHAGPTASYLERHGDGSGLDLVHLCCLARCWRSLAAAHPELQRDLHPLLTRLEAFRAPDGGYHPIRGSAAGTAYAAFLAVGAYQDLDVGVPRPARLAESLSNLETPDGAWANERGVPQGSTNATAAAVAVLRSLQAPVRPSAREWLQARRHPQGGFVAAAGAPLPDLLSTATALHALASLEAPLDILREPCLDFIDTLWTNAGGFYGHWADDQLDVEYTFYGLLALGHLSPA